MSQPPHGQKEHEKQMVDSIQATNMTGLPIPSTTFEILKGGFDTPTQTIVCDALATGGPIGNHQERLLFAFLPTGTQIGLNWVLLPQTNVPIKPLPRLA